MAPVAVTGIAKDETGRRDSRAWEVFTQAYRAGDTGEVITTKSQIIQVVAGVFTATLEPGPAVLVNPDGKRYFVTIPDTDISLSELVDQAESVPPDTSTDILTAAVEAFVTNNPGYPYTGLADLPAALAAGANQPNGYLALGSDGKADAAQLPSYVDDVVEYANQAAFPGTGTTGKIYVALDTGDSFRWSGSAYVRISDRVTASGITDATALTRSFIQAADDATARGVIYAGMAQRSRYGSRTVVDGDSIMIGSGTTTWTWNQSRGGWTMELQRLSNGRIDIVNNAGVSSTGIDERLTNFDTKVAAFNPETVILCNGTNNETVMSLSTYLTKLTEYYDKVRAIGAQLILGAVYPKNVHPDNVSTWNAAFVEWAKVRGVLVIPFWELGDPSSGAWPASWTSDGLHPLKDSGAYAALGALAWQTVARAFTEPIAPTARYEGEGLYSNFFTNLTTAITATAAISGLAATTGTLPAGTYTYRAVAANFYGNGASPSDSTITLSSTGGVVVSTTGAGSGAARRRIYRKGPGETQFRYVGQISSTGSVDFTDNGVTAQYAWVDGDSSRYPVGLANSSFADLHTLAYGPLIGTDPEIRGNYIRLSRQELSVNQRVEGLTATGLTAGQTIAFACKVRGSNTVDASYEQIRMKFLDPTATTTIESPVLFSHRLGTDWGLAFGRFVVPAGSDRVTVGFEASPTSPYMDVGEVRIS